MEATSITTPAPGAFDISVKRGSRRPQVHAYADVVVAAFPTTRTAELGLDLLRQAGFGVDQCGLVAREGELTYTRGLLARASCADCGPFEALRKLGVPADAARLCQQTFDAGQTVVAVQAPGCCDKAATALRRASRADTPQALIDRRPLKRQPADRPVARRRS